MSGLRQFTPPSMKGLNFNIDDDLIFTGTWNKIYDCDYMMHTNDSRQTTIKGGASYSATLALSGNLYGTKGFSLGVPNATLTANENILSCAGGAYFRELQVGCLINMQTHRITDLAQATTDMDAVPQAVMWKAYTPTWVWSVTPGSPTITGRYCQIGKTVFFHVRYTSADSNAGTATSFTLPVSVTGQVATFSAWCQNTSAYTPVALICFSNVTVANFRLFPATTDGQQIDVFVSGHYEV